MRYQTLTLGCLMCVSTSISSAATVKGSSTPPEVPHLRVHLCDGSGLSSFVLRTVKREVGEMLGGSDLAIRWSDGCPVFDTRPDSPKVRAYLLRRLPERMRRRLELFEGSVPLAWFGRFRESPQAMIYVSREAVEAKLRLPKDEDASGRLGRALGRVLAHELAHYYLGPCHARHGLLKPSLSPGDLEDPTPKDLFLTSDQRAALLAFAKAVPPPPRQ
jgi:hypothetical protein